MTPVNWDAARFGFDILQTVFMAGVAVYVWWTNRTHATKQSIDAVDERVGQVERAAGERANQLEHKINAVEKDVQHLPKHDDLGELHDKVNHVANTMSEVKGELHGINRTLGLINEYLLNQGGKNR